MEELNVGDRVLVYGKGYTLKGTITQLTYAMSSINMIAHIITDDGMSLDKDTRFISKI